MNAKQRRNQSRKFKYTMPANYHPRVEDDKLRWLMKSVGEKNFMYLDWKRLGFVREKDAMLYKLRWM